MLALLCLLAPLAAQQPPADEPLGNVRVTVSLRWDATDARTGAAVVARPGVVGVTGDVRRSQSKANTQQQLLVMSGGRASIRIAQEIPYSEWFWSWGLNHGLWTEGVRWRDVATGMEVEPQILPGGRIRVRLTPYFEYLLDAKRQTTKVHQLATEVVVREGQDLDVGGVPFEDTEFRERFLIGFDNTRATSRATVTLRATVE